MSKTKITLFKFFNLLYYKAYFLYKPLYFFYKEKTEQSHINLLKKYVKPGMVAVDIGANIGFYTLFLAKLVGDSGHVYAFEPDNLNFKHLKKNLNGYKNVTLVKQAIADKTGEVNLFRSNDLNVDHQTYDLGEKRQKSQVKSTSLDDFLKGNVDIIKIDIQGYEYYAVLGMVKTVKKSKRLIIISELWPYGLKKSGVNPADYIRLLKELRFKVTFLDQQRRNWDTLSENKLFYCDFFALKN